MIVIVSVSVSVTSILAAKPDHDRQSPKYTAAIVIVIVSATVIGAFRALPLRSGAHSRDQSGVVGTVRSVLLPATEG